MTRGASAGRRIEVGSRWTAKDGARTIVIEVAPPRHVYDPWVRVRNVETGREWYISVPGLWGKYVPDVAVDGETGQ